MTADLECCRRGRRIPTHAAAASPVWPALLDYLDDGARFWRERGAHHPFLLPAYRGDGRKYHRTFSRIGFGPANADEICFVELLHVPTFGRSALIPSGRLGESPLLL